MPRCVSVVTVEPTALRSGDPAGLLLPIMTALWWITHRPPLGPLSLFVTWRIPCDRDAGGWVTDSRRVVRKQHKRPSETCSRCCCCCCCGGCAYRSHLFLVRSNFMERVRCSASRPTGIHCTRIVPEYNPTFILHLLLIVLHSASGGGPCTGCHRPHLCSRTLHQQVQCVSLLSTRKNEPSLGSLISFKRQSF